MDIIQPDCTKCGGLTEAWRIAWMAYEHNIQLVPHGWNTAIGLAADLQLRRRCRWRRYVEFLTPSPYVDELITDAVSARCRWLFDACRPKSRALASN